MHKLILPATLVFGLSMSIPLLLSKGQTWALLASLDPLYLGLLVLLIFLQWNLNALRSRILLSQAAEELSQRITLLYVMANDFALKSTPGGIAAPFLAISMLKRHQVPAATTVSALALIHFLDLILMLFLISLGSLWVSAHLEQGNANPLFSITALSLLALIILLALTIRYYREIALIIGRMLNRIPRTQLLSVRAGRQLIRLKKSINSFISLPRSQQISILILSIFFWILQCSALYLAARSLQAPVPWIVAASTQIMAMTAGRLSLIPGGAAASELTAIAILTFWIPPPQAAMAVLIWRAASLYIGLILGGASLAFLSRHSNIPTEIKKK